MIVARHGAVRHGHGGRPLPAPAGERRSELGGRGVAVGGVRAALRGAARDGHGLLGNQELALFCS